MELGIPSKLARLESALTSADPVAATAEMADGLVDPALLDLLFRLEARRLTKVGPRPRDDTAPTPAGLARIATQVAAAGRLPAATAAEIRQDLRSAHHRLGQAGAWRGESPAWWEPMPEQSSEERLLDTLDALIGDSIPSFPADVIRTAFGSESERRWLTAPALLPAEFCRSLHAALESAFQDGALDLQPGAVGAGTVSSARQDAVHHLTGLEPWLFPRLSSAAVLVQWCLSRLLPRLAAALSEFEPRREMHPPAKAMLARYEGPSGGYRTHLDNPGGSSDNGRAVAILLYLNDPARPCSGGELTLWATAAAPSSPPARVVAPEGGSLAVFDSRATPHQVRPLTAGPPRWSLAMWLHDEPSRPIELPTLPELSPTDVLLPVESPPLPAETLLFHELDSPDPAGTIVVRRAGREQPRAGVVTTAYAAGADMERWCRHHVGLGFQHLVVVFDRIEEPAEAATAQRLREQFADSQLTIWSSAALANERWTRVAAEKGLEQLLAAAAGGSSPQAVASRQALNATAALLAAGTDELGGTRLDWLLHLDADELFHLEGRSRGGGDLDEHFAALAQAGVAAASYLNHELLLPAPGPARFKRNPRLAVARLGPAGWARLADHLHMRHSDPRPYFSGYVNGKAAVAVVGAAAAAGVHGWRLKSAQATRRVLAGPSVLHWRFATAGAYCRKYLAMAGSVPGDETLFESGRADTAAYELVRSLHGADPATVRAELLGLRDSLTGFTEPEADLLEEAGLLFTPDLEFGLAVDDAAPLPAAARPSIRVTDRGEPLKSVGILGGGTAGYLAALGLRRYRPDLDVTLVHSSELPVIGVGEATTPLMPQFLHADLGLDVREFFRTVRPTFKLGIRFEWGEPRDRGFNYPFGRLDLIDAQRFDGHIENCSQRSMMMSAAVLPMERSPSGWHSHLDRATAYHLENQRFVAYLAGTAKDAGVTRIDAVIREALVGDPGRGVEALVTEDGRRLAFDAYVDCSGFSSVLMGESLTSDFLGYEAGLFTDRAVIAAVPNGGRPAPYTLAEGMDAGWCWSTPQPEADHRGYVFSSAFATTEQAIAEMRRRNPAMGDHRTLAFRPGRRRHFRRGNVFALGNAYGFVEPLESTALHMLIRQIGLMLGALSDVSSDNSKEAALNQKVGAFWDYLAWFLALHYRFNRRADTPFWQACRTEADVDLHGDLLAAFRKRGPLTGYEADTFDYPDPLLWGPAGIDAILLGQQVETPLPPGTTTRPEWETTLRSRRQRVEQATSQERALEVLTRHPELLDRFARNFEEVGPAFGALGRRR